MSVFVHKCVSAVEHYIFTCTNHFSGKGLVGTNPLGGQKVGCPSLHALVFFQKTFVTCVYFDRISTFEALYHGTSIKGGVHTWCINS